MANVTSATALSLNVLQLVFDAAIDDTTASAWTVSPVGTGQAVTVVESSLNGPATAIELWCEPLLSPNQAYTITTTALALGVPIGAFPFGVTIPAQLVPPSAEWPHGPLRAITRAFGQELQILAGQPTTITVQDFVFAGFAQTAPVNLMVESSLGFPDSGALWVGSRKIRYFGKGPAALMDAREVWPDGTTIPKQTLVMLDVDSIIPN